MVDIAAALSTISTAIALAKDIRAVDKEIDKADLKLKIADLTVALADTKTNLVEIKEELDAREGEITRLKSVFEFSGQLVEARGFKYEASEDGRPKGTPYCPRCEQTLGRFYRLNKKYGKTSLLCPECKNEYDASVYNWE